ncbi:hypothetical protein AAFF_G00289410 [Aldrovandia affinis]|uniref:Uncharacterized protein n=1 Tax=Aldrovandia affinis TaxID=143900 RepID=A0AAD7R9N1_9TELE|nr:hypothetical protein AAFF_G00289410 [Aldrovandia affinis]
MANKKELAIILRYAAGRFNGKLDCHVCKQKQFQRLDKHLLVHKDLTRHEREKELRDSKRKANLLNLLQLRASKPIPAMVTSLDVNLLAEDDVPGDLLNEFRHHSTDEEEGGEADPPMEDQADQKVLKLWNDHMCGDARKQRENARQKIMHVREWMAFMCCAGVPTMRFKFLKDLPG